MAMSVRGYKNINVFNRWGIIISSGLMAVILIISWILWLIFYRTNINEILLILNQVINDQCLEFNITFQILTIIILGFAAIILVVITIPLIFLKKQGITTLLLTLLMLAIVITFFIGSILLILLVVSGYEDFYDYVVSEKIIIILFFILPWVLELICCLFLIGFCLWLLIANLIKKNNIKLTTVNTNDSSPKEILPITNSSLSKENLPITDNLLPKENLVATNDLLSKENLTVTNDQNFPLIEEQPVISPILSEHVVSDTNKIIEQKPQGINIVITNNTAFPQTKLTESRNNLVTNNPNFVQNDNTINSELVWTLQQIEEVWNKGEIIDDYNPQLYRKDYAGALMFRNSFINNIKLNDDPKSYNWTIVYQQPLAYGGTSDISNLQPMNNINAITKANNYPHWKTAITFDGKQNILKQKSWKAKK